MRSDSSVTVNYANHTYSFMKFQEQYKNLCQNISEAKRREVSHSLKRASSFFYEYKTFVKSSELRDKLDNNLKELKEELFNDAEFIKLCNAKNKNNTELITFNQRYYYYLVCILKFIGELGDELSMTFMPNKTDREKLFKFWNNNSFFEQFTYYKSNTADHIADFNIGEFKKGFAYFMGFYFAYYLFIDEKSRHFCENLFSNILNIVLHKDVLNLVISRKELSTERSKELKDVENNIHDAINSIFFRCNYSYSLYGIMPRMEQKVLTDKTSI